MRDSKIFEWQWSMSLLNYNVISKSYKSPRIFRDIRKWKFALFFEYFSDEVAFFLLQQLPWSRYSFFFTYGSMTNFPWLPIIFLKNLEIYSALKGAFAINRKDIFSMFYYWFSTQNIFRNLEHAEINFIYWYVGKWPIRNILYITFQQIKLCYTKTLNGIFMLLNTTNFNI